MATVVLSIVVLALIQTQASNLSASLENRELVIAANELNLCMEDARSRTVRDLLSASSPFQPGLPIAGYQDRVLRDQVVHVQFPGYTPGAPAPARLTVELTITWSGHKKRVRRLTSSSIVAP